MIHLTGPLLYSTGAGFKLEYCMRIPTIIQSFIADMFWTGNWNIVWLLLFISLFNLKQRIIIAEVKILGFSLTVFLITYALLFLSTPIYMYLADHSGSLLSRLFLHFFPLIPLLIVFLNAPLENHKDSI